jgi:hypothetical protein
MQKKIPVSKRNLDGKILEELVRMAKIQKKEVDALNYQESLVLVTKGTKQASSKQMDSNAGLIKAKLELAQMFIQCNDFKQAGKATQQIVSLLRKPIKEERNVYLYSRAFGLASRLHDSKMERQLLANLLSGSKAILKALPSSDPEQNRRAAAYAQALLAVAKLAESANPRTQNSTDSLSGQMRKMVEDGVLILVQTDPRGGRLSSAVNQFKRVNNLLSQSQKDCLESELKQYVSAADLDDKQKYRNSPLVAILADLNNANNKTDDTCASSADSAKSNALSKIFSGNNLGKEPSCTDLRSAISGHGGAGSNQPDRKQVKAYQDLLEKTRGLFEQGKYAEVKANAEKLVAMALSLYSRFSNEYMSMTVEAAYWSLIAGDFASGDHYLYDLKTGGQKSALTFVISPSRFAIRAMMIQAIALAADGDLKRAQAYLICALRLSPVSGTSSQVASGSNGADFLKMLGTQIKTNAGNNSGAQDWTSCLGDTNLSESDKKALEGIATQVLGFIGQLGEMISKEVEGQSASSAVTGQALEASVDGQIVSYIRQSLENTGAYELEEEALNFWIKDLEEKQSTQDLLAGVRQWLCLVYLKQANSLRKTGDMTNSQAAFAKAKVLHDQIVATKSPSTAKTFSFLKDFNGDYAKLVDQFSSSTSKKRERCPG